MLTSPKTRYLATALLYLSVFVPSISAAFDIKDYFNVATTGAGSCEKYLPVLSNYLEEAFEIAAAGYSAIERLEDKAATFTDARHYYMMFTVDTISYHKGKQELTEGEKNEFIFVKAILNPIQMKNRNPRLYCDSKFLTHTEMAYDEKTGKKTDKTLIDIGKKKLPVAVRAVLTGMTSKGLFPPGWPIETKGAYWSADDKAYALETDASADKTPCWGTVEAFRIQELPTIVLCPSLLDGEKRKSLKPYARGDIVIKHDETLDSYISIPGTFMHEIAHMIGEGGKLFEEKFQISPVTLVEINDQQAYDVDGKEVKGKATYGMSPV